MRRFVCLTVSCLALAACSESNPASDVSGAAQGDESPSPETGSEIAEPPPPPRVDEDLSDVMDDVLDVASPPAMDMDALTEEPEDAVTPTEPEDAVTPTEPEAPIDSEVPLEPDPVTPEGPQGALTGAGGSADLGTQTGDQGSGGGAGAWNCPQFTELPIPEETRWTGTLTPLSEVEGEPVTVALSYVDLGERDCSVAVDGMLAFESEHLSFTAPVLLELYSGGATASGAVPAASIAPQSAVPSPNAFEPYFPPEPISPGGRSTGGTGVAPPPGGVGGVTGLGGVMGIGGVTGIGGVMGIGGVIGIGGVMGIGGAFGGALSLVSPGSGGSDDGSELGPGGTESTSGGPGGASFGGSVGQVGGSPTTGPGGSASGSEPRACSLPVFPVSAAEPAGINLWVYWRMDNPAGTTDMRLRWMRRDEDGAQQWNTLGLGCVALESSDE